MNCSEASLTKTSRCRAATPDLLRSVRSVSRLQHHQGTLLLAGYGQRVVGESQREIEYPAPVGDAMDDVESALGSVGRLLESSRTLNTAVGKTRYGLQSVKLRISVVDTGRGTSLIKIGAFGDDVWGGGARKGTDKLLKALEATAAARRP